MCQASVTSSRSRARPTASSRTITNGDRSYAGVVKNTSGSPSRRACFSASSPTYSTAMSVRMTRGRPGPKLRIGPDEAPVADPEVEAVAVDLHRMRKAQRDPADVVCINHADRRVGPFWRFVTESLARCPYPAVVDDVGDSAVRRRFVVRPSRANN